MRLIFLVSSRALTPNATWILLLVVAIIATSAQSLRDMAFTDSLLGDSVVRRAETVGATCSSEGQWNCMTTSWQRCAAGQWSKVMDSAEGTICSPAGMTENLNIEHDGSVDGRSRGRSGSSVPIHGRMVSCASLFTTLATLLFHA
ncbi:hypothetical protein HJFPF1_01012 [Paramyrothecium foliicola]|nr:hypothetical protein HJFPF1_01012 [Paramyrothecium foliicola]